MYDEHLQPKFYENPAIALKIQQLVQMDLLLNSVLQSLTVLLAVCFFFHMSIVFCLSALSLCVFALLLWQ